MGKAAGSILEPWQIRRVGKARAEVEALAIEKRAEAEAKAAIIRRSDVGDSSPALAEVRDLQARAARRLVTQEVRRQANLESIVLQASDSAHKSERHGASARPLEDDWINTFLEYCQNISNGELQGLWAKILASQATEDAPRVSKATLDSIRLIEPVQAAMFERAVRLFLGLGQIMDVDAIEGLDVGYQSRMLESTALEDLGLLRAVRDLESSLDVRGGVLTFWRDVHPGATAGDYVHWTDPQARDFFLELVQGVAKGNRRDPGRVRENLRVDRQILTSRGYELASIFITDFTECFEGAYCTSPSLGDFADRAIQSRILAQWASRLSAQGAAVILSHPVTEEQRLQSEDSGRKSDADLGRSFFYELDQIFNPNTERWESLGK